MRLANSVIVPDWPAPPNVKGYSTTREGGVSEGVYASLNLSFQVGDNPTHVAANMERLRRELNLPNALQWLNQQHTDNVIELTEPHPGSSIPIADGAYTRTPGVVLAIRTADCMPILICDQQGESVMALHAGWRGLVGGIITRGIQTLGVPAEKLYAWLGPCIGPSVYTVGPDVHHAFSSRYKNASEGLQPTDKPEQWLLNLSWFAKRELNDCGVTHVFGNTQCTYQNPSSFFSYRRDGVTGRMASLIWL